MNSLTDFILDDSGDLMLAQHEDGSYDLMSYTGAEVVAQSVIIRLRTKLGSIWYNRSAGIDQSLLSQDSRRTNNSVIPYLRGIYRAAILAVDGVIGFEKEMKFGVEKEKDIIFSVDSQSRAIKANVPCFLIDCENSIYRGVISPEQIK